MTKQRILLSRSRAIGYPSPTNVCFMAEHPSQVYPGRSPRSPTAPHRWPRESEERRSRAPEFYGFVAWTSTYLLFVLYILWAILPEQYIERIGMIWYPSRCVCCGFLFFNFITNCFNHREWAILIPSWTIIVIILTYIVYFAIAIRATPSFDDMSAISGTYLYSHLLDDKSNNVFMNRFP